MQNSFQVLDPSPDLLKLAFDARTAAIALSRTSNESRKIALNSMAESLLSHSSEILQANVQDLEKASSVGLSSSLMARLKLGDKKLEGAIDGIRQLASLDDPIGISQLRRELDDGLILQRITVPLGVLGVIFEARPDALIQIAALAIRSGNAAIMKGGREASHTNKSIIKALKEALVNTSINPNSLSLLTTRDESISLLKLENLVDLIIPRGSNELVRFIQQNTNIPVLGHADGICHLYIDENANIEKALAIAIDSKTQYPAACNAIETLLVHHNIAELYIPKLIPLLREKDVRLVGDKSSMNFGITEEADEIDWSSEYLDLKLSIKVVNSIESAIDHIRKYSSRHTDAIVTENKQAANLFLTSVDSSGVYHNCSTRFADGFRYGFGAEVGISTQTMPPRGPVGLEGLVTYRYNLIGDGHIAEDYVKGLRSFKHKDI